MRKIVLIVLSVGVIMLLAGCSSNEQKADSVVFKTLGSVLTIKDRPLANRIIKISYDNVGKSKPGQRTAYYVKGYVTVRRTALRNFMFRGQIVPMGATQDYRYFYEARVVEGVKNTLVIVPSGLYIRNANG